MRKEQEAMSKKQSEKALLNEAHVERAHEMKIAFDLINYT